MIPALSVIMPIYNVELYIGKAIESVLYQTFEDFEFIIIDDGSTDKTYDIISAYHDKRIIIIRNQINKGLAKCLNQGFLIAKAEYIIRMDGDDICKPERFSKQIQFMLEHPNLGISGTYMDLIDEQGKLLGKQQKTVGFKNIMVKLFFGNTSLAHPSIIVRKKLLDINYLRYDCAFRYAEDFDLYCRSSLYVVLDNYPEYLIQYRIHPNSVSQKFHQQQLIDAQTALYLHLRRLKLPFSLDDFKIHMSFSLKLSNSEEPSQDVIDSWINYLLEWNKNNNVFDKEIFHQYCMKYKK